ncbi:MAG: rubrerythrin family protein [Candidatus Buchananbacteria bacterium]
MQETLKCLAKAYVGESQARNRYSFYASKAKKEGYEQIAGNFLETAEQEKEHAKKLFETIQILKEKMGADFPDEVAEIILTKDAFILGTTAENLQSAVDGETYEHTTMYPEFAEIADKEGLPEIANRLRSIAKAEEHHHERYQKLLDNLKAGTVFKKDEEVFWVCRECGYVHFGKEAPEVCPSCDHAQAFYQLKSENY